MEDRGTHMRSGMSKVVPLLTIAAALALSPSRLRGIRGPR